MSSDSPVKGLDVLPLFMGESVTRLDPGGVFYSFVWKKIII